MENRCGICGELIPLGRAVCSMCAREQEKDKTRAYQNWVKEQIEISERLDEATQPRKRVREESDGA